MAATDLDPVIEAVRAGVANRRLLLLCDFDGTLSEFDPDPAAVWLSDTRRRVLLDIERAVPATIGIVSGRRLEDVRRRTALAPTAYYAGLHGLEIEGNGEAYLHPAIAGTHDLLRGIAIGLSAEMRSLEGVFVEDKGLSIVVHFRSASPDDAVRAAVAFEQYVRPEVDGGRLRVLPGSSIFELLPNIDWNKGDAVTWIRGRVEAQFGPAWPVYIGDDITDEDAFRAVRGDGLAIASSTVATGADFVVDGPAGVDRVLAALAQSAPGALR